MLVVEAVFDHDNRVVLVCLLEGWHESARIHEEGPFLLTQVSTDYHGLHSRVPSEGKNVLEPVIGILPCQEIEDLPIPKDHLRLT